MQPQNTGLYCLILGYEAIILGGPGRAVCNRMAVPALEVSLGVPGSGSRTLDDCKKVPYILWGHKLPGPSNVPPLFRFCSFPDTKTGTNQQRQPRCKVQVATKQGPRFQIPQPIVDNSKHVPST